MKRKRLSAKSKRVKSKSRRVKFKTKRTKGFKNRLEKFHDENRYFIPVLFVGFILMMTGLFYLGPVVLDYDIDVNRPLSFSGDAVIQSVTLRPEWTLEVNVLANKRVTVSLFNLDGEVVAESNNNSLVYSPDFLNLYFIEVHGDNYAILDFSYRKVGLAPYPTSFLFFGFGLILILGSLVYYLLEPWGFKLKRYLELGDALFYPAVFLLSPIIFWIFRDAMLWFLPKSLNMTITTILVLLSLIVFSSILMFNESLFARKKKWREFYKSLFGFFIAYSLVFIIVLLSNAGLVGYWLVIVKSIVIGYLILLYLYSKSKTALVIFTLTWLVSIVIKVLSYSIGIPVIFDTFLTYPSAVGTVPLFMVISLFITAAIYFILRGYYSKDKARAVDYGLYASVCIQAFLQIYTGATLL